MSMNREQYVRFAQKADVPAFMALVSTYCECRNERALLCRAPGSRQILKRQIQPISSVKYMYSPTSWQPCRTGAFAGKVTPS